MDEQPSRTAVWTAAARAAHLIVDSEPRIFEDTLAGLLLGDTAKELIGAHRDSVDAQNLAHLRVAVTTRSRYTEHRLAEAVRRGIGQYVILGAGLDSFAYRSPFADQLRVFEVDHASTQAWKRERLGAASIGVPRWLTFVSVDFRIDSLRDRLLDMGFETTRPAFVSWLGVAEYLTTDAIATTLDAISGLAHGTELVMEYLVPAELRDEPGHAVAEFFMSRAAQSGEPWLTFFTPAAIAEILAARGLIPDDDVGRKAQIEPSLWQRSDGLRPNELGRIVHAVVARRVGAA